MDDAQTDHEQCYVDPDSAEPAIANDAPRPRRNREVWETGSRFSDQVNLIAVVSLILGPVIVKVCLEMQRAWAPDISGWNEIVLAISALAAIWGLIRTVQTYSEWNLPMFVTVAGVVVMVCGWLYFSATAPVLVGGFTMVAGAILLSRPK